MEIEQIKELMEALEKSSLSRLMFKKGDLEIRLEKDTVGIKRPSLRTVLAENATESAFQSELSLQAERGFSGSSRFSAPQPVTGTFALSPMVGTFYTSGSPDQPPLVKIGDRVDEQTVVCIVEAMKVMNEVKAGVSGTIVEILVANAQPVEFGTRLFRVQ